MNNSQAIESTIFVSSHPDVIKRTSISGLILSVIMLIAGLSVFVSAFQLDERSSTLSMFLMVLGTAFLLFGVFRLFWKSREMVYAPTGSVTREASLFFDSKHEGKLTSLLESSEFVLGSDIKSTTSGNLRLDALLSQDSNFAAVQLFQFVPYTYNPVTKVFYFTGEKARALSTYLHESKK